MKDFININNAIIKELQDIDLYKFELHKAGWNNLCQEKANDINRIKEFIIRLRIEIEVVSAYYINKEVNINEKMV